MFIFGEVMLVSLDDVACLGLRDLHSVTYKVALYNK